MAGNTSSLEELLEAFTLGELPLHKLLAEFEAAIAADPQNSQYLSDLLENYLNQGEITITAYKQIKSEITLASDTNLSELDSTQAATTMGGEPDNGITDNLAGELEETVFSAQNSKDDGTALSTADETGSLDLDDFTEQGSGSDHDDDATEIALDDDATEVVAETSGGKSSWPGSVSQGTGSSWSDPSSWVDSGEPLGVGSVIKERFELVERLGIGGMGVVYKALDRRKVEAQDRDPYLAVKILNDEFKQHPNALQALQREARKTQELAHPNIMTVYDFDRVGSDVYMTMEFLDGDPLDVVIKKRKGKPFPEEEAMVMIEGMSEALAYAHRRNLVHSDFKPGNVFLTNKGTIKVLDFGIAARVTNPIVGEEDDGADKTVFDVKQFGAFTPAYATCEIMEGAEPDPRDDIYALGCVSYQLLGGKHPFNRKRATFARDNGLVPEPIATLSRRQQKALNKSLAFSHEACTPTVEEFIDGMRRRKSRLVPIAASIAALLIITVFALRTTLVDYLQQQEHDRIMVLLESADQQEIVAGLNELEQTEEPLRSALIADARETILAYYETQTSQLIDDTRGAYNFPQAASLVDDARALYPDSAQIERMLDTIGSRRSRLLNQLTSRFNAALESGSLLADPDSDDITDVLQLVKQINPAHPLLNDPRLPPAYAHQAEKALTEGNYSLASGLALAGLDYFPNNVSLMNVRDETDAQRQESESRAKVARLTADLERRPVPKTIADFTDIRDPLIEISELDPENPVLARLQQAVQAFVPSAVNQLIADKQWANGSTFLSDFGDLLTSAQIIEQQGKLLSAKDTYDSQVAVLLDTFEAALGTGNVTAESLNSSSQPLAQLAAYAVADDPNLRYARNRMAYGYLTLARQARASATIDTALAMATLGSQVQPGGIVGEAINAELEIAGGGGNQYRNINTRDLTEQFRVQLAQSNDPGADAPALLAVLTQVATADPASTAITNGRAQLADRLNTQVTNLVASNSWDEASDLAQTARLIIPELPATNLLVAKVNNARQSAEGAIKQQQIDTITADLQSLLANAKFDPAWEAEVRGNWRRLQPLLTDQPDQLNSQENALAQTFITSASQSQAAQLFVEARNKLRAGQRILPDNPEFNTAYEALTQAQSEFRKLEVLEAKAGEIEGLKQTLLTQTKAKSVAEASSTFAKLKRLLPENDPFLTNEVPDLLGPTYLEMAQNLGDQGQFVEALKLARAGLVVAPAMSELKNIYARYEDEAVLAKLAAQFQAARGPSTQATDILNERITSTRERAPGRADELITQFSDLFSQRAAETQSSDPPAYRAWLAKGRELFPNDTRFASVSSSSASGRACTAKIAGYGKRNAGICYDVVARNSRGPLMVVIPADQPYAMSKYEISRQDFDLFCTESNQCSASGADPLMPMADVSFEQAVEYSRWLSEQTGKTYRLPNDDEWVSAATGDGNLSKDFNCLLKLGGNVIKGANLLPINSGKANSWGLHNPVGNVQEYTADGSVRGGAYKDTMSNCDISLKRNHPGSADEITGFRVLQELKG